MKKHAVIGGAVTICLGAIAIFMVTLSPQTPNYPYAQYFAMGVVFIGAIYYLIKFRERVIQAEFALQKQQIQNLTYERQILETNLRSLQVQIEPHFLFNTLSTILSLIDKDPVKGKAMLQSFTRYLRAAIDYTRAECATLEDELKIVTSYLEIFKVRMGDRLSYCIDVPRELQYIQLPPMLLQPLVENAIQHGLEPAIEGGNIRVSAQSFPHGLRIAVEDTGLGIRGDCGDGVGLTNIQKRLQILYGDSATLSLQPNKPRGLRAIIEVPYEEN